jgi:toxin YoeB
MYRIEFTVEAAKEALRLKKSEPQAYRKLEKLLQELQEHPATGTGKPKLLSGNRAGQWSRRITHKHRLVYTVENEVVFIVAIWGHYND